MWPTPPSGYVRTQTHGNTRIKASNRWTSTTTVHKGRNDNEQSADAQRLPQRTVNAHQHRLQSPDDAQVLPTTHQDMNRIHNNEQPTTGHEQEDREQRRRPPSPQPRRLPARQPAAGRPQLGPQQSPVQWGDQTPMRQQLQKVDKMVVLGSMAPPDTIDVHHTLQHRINSAWAAWTQVRPQIVQRVVPLRARTELVEAVVKPSFLWDESLNLNHIQRRKLDGVQRAAIKRVSLVVVRRLLPP